MDEQKTKCVEALLNESSKTKSSDGSRKKKPKTFQVEESSVLSRVRQFLPQIEAANRSLPDQSEGPTNSIVDFEPIDRDAASESDEETEKIDRERKMPEDTSSKPLASVEMNLALYEYSSSSDDEDSESESRENVDESNPSSPKLRLSPEKTKKKPKIEIIRDGSKDS